MNMEWIIESRLIDRLNERQLKIYDLLLSGIKNRGKLSKLLNVSRVTIWKDIRKIRKEVLKIIKEEI